MITNGWKGTKGPYMILLSMLHTSLHDAAGCSMSFKSFHSLYVRLPFTSWLVSRDSDSVTDLLSPFSKTN